MGALQHYIVTEDGFQTKNFATTQNQWQSMATWGKTYASQTNVLHWCDERSVLFLGQDSGVIHRYQCFKEKNLKVAKDLPDITVHQSGYRVMGLSVDPNINHMFSISESGFLLVTDLNDKDSKFGAKCIS